MIIWHNNRCTKSRQTLALIEENGVKPEIVHYLENSPSKAEIKDVLAMLGMKAEDIVRKGETIFKENYKGKSLSEEQWLDALVKYPKLIERPIVIENGKAKIGRPPENVLDLLK